MAMYEKRTSTMYTTFFGGISRYQWDPASRTFTEFPKVGTKSTPVYLDGMEWSDQISTVSCVMPPGAGHPPGGSSRASGLVGAGEGAFIPAILMAVVMALQLEYSAIRNALESDTEIGYIYGGIRAYPYRFPYNKSAQPYNSGGVPTKPSDIILKVYLRRSAGPSTAESTH